MLIIHTHFTEHVYNNIYSVALSTYSHAVFKRKTLIFAAARETAEIL